MKFKNKLDGKIIEVKGYVQEFAYSHNSNYEKSEEKAKKEVKKEA